MTPVSISAAGTDCAARTSDTAIAAVRVKTLLGFILFVCIVRILYLSLPPDDPGAVNGAVHTNIVKKSTVTYNTPNLFLSPLSGKKTALQNDVCNAYSPFWYLFHCRMIPGVQHFQVPSRPRQKEL